MSYETQQDVQRVARERTALVVWRTGGRTSAAAYALTDERIIIVTRAFGRQVKSLTLSALSETSLRERDDRSGTITLGPTSGPNALFGGSGWSGGRRYTPPALVGIDNVRSVYDQILAAQEAAQHAKLTAQ
jgi:hypothetical protein